MLVAILTLTGGTDVLPLIDRDEPRFARATIEMIGTEQWVIPYFNGEYRFDKPPLTYWWMRIHYNLLGVNEFAARLHSVLAGYFCALAIFGFGRKLFGIKPAFLAAFAWLTSLQVLIHSRMAVADMPMVLAVILVIWSAWEILTNSSCKRFGFWYWVFWLSMVLGFLAKGPIAFIVPVLSWLLYRFAFYRKPVPFGRLQFFSGSTFFLILIGLWGIPALIETKGAFWDVGIGEHIVKRGTAAFNSRISFPGYYLISSFLSLMPWAAFIWGGAVITFRNRDAQSAYLFSWLLSSFLIFSFYATQLPHYTLPSLAAFFLLLFRPDRSGYKPGTGEKIFFWGIFSLYSTAALLPGILLLTEDIPEHLIQVRGILAGAMLLLVALLSIAAAYRFRKPAIAISGVIGVYIATSYFSFSMRQASPIVAIQKTLKLKPAEGQWTGVEFSEPGLVFYGEQQWRFKNRIEDVTGEIHDKKNGYVIKIQEYRIEDYFKKLFHGKPIDPGKDYQSRLKAIGIEPTKHENIWGINFARVSWINLIVIPPENTRHLP